MPRTKKMPYRAKWEAVINRNYSDDDISRLADEMLEWISSSESENKPPNFWLNDFAVMKKLVPSQILMFCSKNNYFNAIYEICRCVQESKLLKMALYKEVNATPAVFILKSIVGAIDSEKPADMESAKQQIEEIFE